MSLVAKVVPADILTGLSGEKAGDLSRPRYSRLACLAILPVNCGS